MTSPAGTRWQHHLTLLLLVVLVLTAGAIVAVMVWAGGGSTDGAGDVVIGALFVLWNVLPVAGMAGVVVVSRRRGPAAAPVTSGVVVLTGLVATLLVDFVGSESSTAALLFVVQPVYLWPVTGLTAGLAAASSWLVGRRRARTQAARDRTAARAGSR